MSNPRVHLTMSLRFMCFVELFCQALTKYQNRMSTDMLEVCIFNHFLSLEYLQFSGETKLGEAGSAGGLRYTFWYDVAYPFLK